MNKDDKDLSLLKLGRRNSASIISQLVDIGNKRNQQDHVKFLSFIRNLQCLHQKGSRLYRQSIDAFVQRQYVALSYTWDPSENESRKRGRYLVENWDDERLRFSSVRKCVFDRALRYMRHNDVRFLWIDAHCIRQDKCVDDCARHVNCIDKRGAMQAMDLVYQLSEHPVALLGWPLRSESELHLLRRILLGNLVNGDYALRVATPIALHVARRALSLLSEITEDRWWSRAWTFQENYRGATRMQLLIRHDSSLETQKRRYHGFGKIPGELSISSVTFSTQATRLCLALREVAGLSLLDTQRIDAVLRAAGRYKLMLHSSCSMTPTVIADIESRGLSKPWDRLAIAANCCQYPLRLDSGTLSRQSRSPSLSLLAMCLLNGEILDNSDDDMASVGGLTTSGFLSKLMFRAFSAPEDDTKRLTFYKGCRLSDVKLTVDGIITKGHLWKLGRVVDTATFPRKLPWIHQPRGRLTLGERKCLLQLVLQLRDMGYGSLANRIEDYLAVDAYASEEYASFTHMYLHRMAVELAAAILKGRKLRLGSIWDRSKPSKPYRGIFVWSDQGSDASHHRPSTFVFTSARQRHHGSHACDTNDIDRHVSLLVDKRPSRSGGMEQLRVCRWVLGMCFFDGCPRMEVLLPWPRVLRELSS